YMVASGLNYERDNSAEHIADFALDMVEAIRDYAERHHFPLAMRVGISTGQVVSGVIGPKKPLFDVGGGTVNLASRTDATSDAGQIAANPAGIARLARPELSAAGTFVTPSLAFRNAGSTFPGGGPINGPNDDGGGFAPVPGFFYAQPVGEGFSAGVGMFTSFGL